ncbi:MAG: hypothetical protein CSA35_01500 [Dethiosulfovibrio peptidovorans]|nr:MAG: hypothetical protein CSA35_01500 [Dethiosulfovibrio peptidovorans]
MDMKPVTPKPFSLERWCTAIASVLLILCLGGALVSLVAHHFMDCSRMWTDRMIRDSLIWIVMLGAVEPLGHRGHRHLRLLHRSGRPLAVVMTLARTVTQAAALGCLIWTGLKAVGHGMEETAVLLGATVMLVAILLRILRRDGGNPRQ